MAEDPTLNLVDCSPMRLTTLFNGLLLRTLTKQAFLSLRGAARLSARIRCKPIETKKGSEISS